MDSDQNQLVEKLRSSANILVTVSRNPSIDQLAACVGLALFLNKFNKHATAVFSGEVPSTMEFLDPESTLEKTTDSLRDFIIALDKSKADKLRYKVEDEMVRIFITPYRTSISQADLEFSQGDFNVDVVIALGVQRQEDLDDAITSHGRILHDAVVSSINTHSGESLGSINWSDPAASSLSELVYDLAVVLNKELIDSQIATALLTGIVAETARFSNEKTTPQTMSVSAALMAAGANQQLVASKLEEPITDQVVVGQPLVASEANSAERATVPKPEPGTLEIGHESDNPEALPQPELNEDIAVAPTFEAVDETMSSEEVSLIGDVKPSDPDDHPIDTAVPFVSPAPQFVVDPPTMGGTLTANSRPEYELSETSLDPLSLPRINEAPLLSRDSRPATPVEATPPPPFAAPAPIQSTQPIPLLTGFTPPPPAWVPPYEDPLHNGSPALEVVQPLIVPPPPSSLAPAAEPANSLPDGLETLADIEQSVHSPHLTTEVTSARDEVMRALNDTSPELPEPIAALNAQPLGGALHDPVNFNQMAQPSPAFTDALRQVIPAVPGVAQPTGYGNVVLPPAQTLPPSSSSVTDPTAPPPVPPPIPFNFGTPPNPPQQ